MFKTLLVDDEPAALEYIQRIIDSRCSSFQVAATARSGEECLEILEGLRVDVVITDIRMKGISGIELIEKIKAIRCNICLIIVSGYSDFEYAKKAITNQVYDYVLKPVDPVDFTDMMERLEKQLRVQEARQRAILFKHICQGSYVSREDLLHYFGDSEYYAFLLRRNNLANRFQGTKDSDVVSNDYESFLVYARDENEVFYLIPSECLNSRDELNSIIENTREKYWPDQGFLTTVTVTEPFGIEKMDEVIAQASEELYKNLVCGVSQTWELGHITERTGMNEQEKENLQKIDYYLSKKEILKAKSELHSLCRKFEERRIPQIQVENAFRQICNSVWMNEGYRSYGSNTEYLLEELLYNSMNMEMLLQNLTDFLFKDAPPDHQKVDTPEYFASVCNYMKNHLEESLSLNSIVREFHVSQGHLSFIFRKYAGQSFNTYLTSMRMEKAKEILENDRNILIKDVAQMVGYQDQFYFSRVFKLYTGVRPTEYERKE